MVHLTRNINNILVTGGLGFIGSHIVDLLLENGYKVRVLDNLDPQVHGPNRRRPEYANNDAEIIVGEITDRVTLVNALSDMDAVIHQAASVGVGQSMYQIEKYVLQNTGGTSTLLDIIVNKDLPIKKIIVASSMSIYGEGKYLCETCGSVNPDIRHEQQLKVGDWEPKCPNCGKETSSAPTDEDKPLIPTSVYSQTKRHQEELCLLLGKSYNIPTVALRYFNVYGPRQSLRNPYTGVCAIFSSRILNNKPPYVFEDGGQLRDFVSVKDIAGANLQALERSSADFRAINIGSGKPISILRLAEILLDLYKVKLKPQISEKYRKGDVRHCYANIDLAKNILDYEPSVIIEDGLKELVTYARANDWASEGLFEKSLKELEERKLT